MNLDGPRCLAGATATITVAALASGADAHASRPWRAPVAGAVTRAFDLGADPFEPGRHRGADFAASPGTIVRAACGGKVLVAGRVGTSGRVVSIRCGPWRASHMPLATVTVHAGATIRRGTKIGTVAPSTDHAGLHLGARRDGTRFGYTDPLRLIGRESTPPPPVAIRRTPRGPAPRHATAPAVASTLAPHASPPLHATPPPHAPPPHATQPPQGASPARGVQSPHGAALPHRSPQPRAVPSARGSQGSSPVAPWPAWAGLAVLLAGALGSGARVRARTRRAPIPHAVAQEVP